MPEKFQYIFWSKPGIGNQLYISKLLILRFIIQWKFSGVISSQRRLSHVGLSTHGKLHRSEISTDLRMGYLMWTEICQHLSNPGPGAIPEDFYSCFCLILCSIPGSRLYYYYLSFTDETPEDLDKLSIFLNPHKF